MAVYVNLTFQDGSPVVGATITVTGLSPGWVVPPTNAQGFTSFAVPAAGSYPMEVTVNGVKYTNTAVADAIGAGNVNWQLPTGNVPVIEEPKNNTLIYAAIGAVGIAAIGYFLLKRKK
jgi:LPXTG-motif cell wall-anchored protein